MLWGWGVELWTNEVQPHARNSNDNLYRAQWYTTCDSGLARMARAPGRCNWFRDEHKTQLNPIKVNLRIFEEAPKCLLSFPMDFNLLGKEGCLGYLHTMRSEPGWSHAGSCWYLLSTETSLTCNQPDLDFSVPCSIAFPLLEPKSIQLAFLSLVTES